MPTPGPIRILAPAKQTGDLFTRLVSDLSVEVLAATQVAGLRGAWGPRISA
jgi:hypothetical protein